MANLQALYNTIVFILLNLILSSVMIKKAYQSLITLFFTEMYERYGFYVIQALLIFYLVQKLHLSDSQSYSIVGAYTAFAYINGSIGGIVADKLLGYDRTIILGAIMLVLGYYICFCYLDNFKIFALGLAIIVTGTGHLKPNISSIISIVYEKPREKETAYNIFYIGLYIGALSGSLLGGYLQEKLGWSIAFMSPAIAMSLGLLCFLAGRRIYNIKDPRQFTLTIKSIIKVIAIQIFVITVSFYSLTNPDLSNYIFMMTVIAAICYMIFIIASAEPKHQKSLLKFFYLIVFSCIYWAIYFQQFFSVSIASTRIFHGKLPNSILTCFVSLGIIIFGPLLTYFWRKLEDKNPSIMIKFSLSFVANFIVFILLATAIMLGNKYHFLLNQTVIVITYFIIAIGELCISPVGLFMVSELVPQDKVGIMMGFFMLSIGIGGKLAGFLAQISSVSDITNISAMQHTYLISFLIYAAISASMFALIMIFHFNSKK
jgi:POT family proton-dependent oligopeptide transporter